MFWFWVNLLSVEMIVAVGVALMLSLVEWAKERHEIKIRSAALALLSPAQLLRRAAHLRMLAAEAA
jgi:hypothetical protein